MINDEKEKNIDKLSIGLKNDYICSELGEQSRLGREGVMSLNYSIHHLLID